MNALFDEATRVRRERGEVYNNGGICLEDYFIYGYKSLLHELHKKVLRLISLESVGKCSIKEMGDSLVDLVNYAAFMYERLEEKAKRGGDTNGSNEEEGG